MDELQYEPMEHREKLAWMIETHGYGVEPVPPVEEPEPRAGYSYTFGLEAHLGHPEIVIFGLAPIAARGLIDMVVGFLRQGGELPVGQQFTGLLDNDLRSAVLDVDRDVHGGRFPALPIVYGDQPWRMRQLVWPDRNGALPWEDGWPHALRYAQPVIGDDSTVHP